MNLSTKLKIFRNVKLPGTQEAKIHPVWNPIKDNQACKEVRKYDPQ